LDAGVWQLAIDPSTNPPLNPAWQTDPGSDRCLLLAIIQVQDYESAAGSLNRAGLHHSRLSSTGGFLGQGNCTLLIGLSKDQAQKAIQILGEVCRRRVEYIATPLEGAPYHMPLPTPVTVGGATIFVLEVERFEELT
jgi:uncharacterized protein YaaQ